MKITKILKNVPIKTWKTKEWKAYAQAIERDRGTEKKAQRPPTAQQLKTLTSQNVPTAILTMLGRSHASDLIDRLIAEDAAELVPSHEPRKRPMPAAYPNPVSQPVLVGPPQTTLDELLTEFGEELLRTPCGDAPTSPTPRQVLATLLGLCDWAVHRTRVGEDAWIKLSPPLRKLICGMGLLQQGELVEVEELVALVSDELMAEVTLVYAAAYPNVRSD